MAGAPGQASGATEPGAGRPARLAGAPTRVRESPEGEGCGHAREKAALSDRYPFGFHGRRRKGRKKWNGPPSQNGGAGDSRLQCVL